MDTAPSRSIVAWFACLLFAAAGWQAAPAEPTPAPPAVVVPAAGPAAAPSLPDAFGYDAFRSNGAPITEGPVDDQYLLGPGDEVAITVWGEMNETLNLTVTDQGFIELPEKAGRIQTNGVTLRELKPLVERALSQRYASFIDAVDPTKSTAFVDVRLGKIRPLVVYVVGEVNTPGAHALSAPVANVVNLLTSAGGVKPSGTLREIKVRRSDGRTDTVDLYGFLLDGKVDARALRLQPGDYVLVPLKRKSVQVAGEVRRPTSYELVGDEGIRALMGYAGGPRPDAYLKRAQLKRLEANRGEVYVDVDLGAALDPSGQDIALKDGDVLTVGRNAQVRTNMVSIRGDGILRPGTYEWTPGMRLGDLVQKGDGLREHAYLDRADLVRTERDFSKRLIRFPLKGLFEKQPDGSFKRLDNAELDIPLEQMDEVLVQSAWGMAGNDKSVTLEGHVKEPGKAVLAEGMTLYDVLFTRGGFQDPTFAKDTYMEVGHLMRKVPGAAGSQIRTFDVGGVLAERPGANMALEDGDVVRIYARTELATPAKVRIGGLVRAPGEFEFADGLTLEDLVVMAGGLDPSVVRAEAVIASRQVAGTESATETTRIVPIESTFATVAARSKTPLRSDDRITIRHQFGWEPLDTAQVSGLVKFPGSYAMPRTGETLTGLVLRAGGLRPEAYPAAATLLRDSGTGERTAVTINLAAALERPGGPEDLALRDGDLLTVPDSAGVVTVRGAVRSESVLQHRAGGKLSEYVRDSGGYLDSADPERVTVTAPNGRTERVGRGQDPVLLAGSVIEVPLQRETERLQLVEVKGAVSKPAVVQHAEGGTLAYYITVCGGYTANADVDRVVVLLPDGGVLERQGARNFNPVLPAGAIVVVTARPAAEVAK
jgi:protein involved in polysaccharide export with SLBB domain